MAEQLRWANQPAAPLAAGDWRCVRGSAEHHQLGQGLYAGGMYRPLTEEPSRGWDRGVTSTDHGGELAHTGNLSGLTHHPILRDDPNILVLEEGPMSQDRLSHLFPNRAAEEAIPPTPTVATVP
ncbi:hypothetical protein BHM03_00062960 [Ensete ventricosum]|nr:hypothetical protein BHM03_00062960 [Ensete ventricosum]